MSEITAIERKIHRLKKDLQPLNERFETILKEATKKQLEIRDEVLKLNNQLL